MGKLSQERRLAINRRDGNRCHYCKALASFLTIDHVIPLARGGTNDDDNLVTACFGCNQLKADKSVAYVMKRVAKVESRSRSIVKPVKRAKKARRRGIVW